MFVLDRGKNREHSSQECE